VPVDAQCQVFMEAILALPALQAWTAAAREEPDDIEELDMEF
jgi:glutathione S-transferase